MREVLVFVAAYLLGSLPFATWVARYAGAGDIRRLGSGNPGATNVARTVGVAAGALVLALDLAKGAAAVWLARGLGLSPEVVAIAGLLAIVGHVLSVWLGFRGGKGVATATAVFALIAPRAFGAAFIVFVVTVVLTRFISLGSIGAAVVLAIATIVGGEGRTTIAVACIAAGLIVVRHAANIQRLREGTEPRAF